MKLTFAMIDFECNGLNPTVKSWGTANRIQISDRGNLKSIYCGKKTQQPYYTDSKEIQVFKFNTVPTHNKHIFVRPKKVCLFWEMSLIWENVLILGS